MFRDAHILSRVPMLVLVLTAAIQAQPFSPLNCTATAVPALVRIEGLTEQVGDIVLNCVGGTPGGLVRGDIRVISFGGNITNKANPANATIDAALTVDTGTGERSTGATAVLRGNNQFDFAGMNFTLGATSAATFRISNVRVVPPQMAQQPFQIALATNGPSAIRIDNSPLTVGVATQGLFASYSSTFICTVSPLPEELTFDSFRRSGARFASMRLTEGFSDAFRQRQAPADHGTRVYLQFSGFPGAAKVYVPETLVGSSGLTPTAAGDLGLEPSAGRYTPGIRGQLLLSYVRNTDSQGAGGSPVFVPPPPGPTITFERMVEVPLLNGAGTAVFEVMDALHTARESVQLPVFLVLTERPIGGSVNANVAVRFGPTSTDGTASAGPVPRFRSVTPPPDCQVLGDCNSGIFPRLTVDSDVLSYDPIIGQSPQTRFIRVRNEGGGLLNWAASVQYRQGGPTGWLTLDPASGLGNGTIRLDANARNLQVGTYEATLVIDAGPLAGTRSLPVRMEARVLGPNPNLPPQISSIVHGATFEAVPLAPGTLATAFGMRLGGQDVRLTVNGNAARIFFSNDTQINFEVPAGLPTTGSANVVVNINGTPAPSRNMPLTVASPGIFTGAVLNQDSSPNTASNPALSGSVIQIFLTGLPLNGRRSVRIHDYTVEDLAFVGAAPGFIGLQQVNVRVPEQLQSITSGVSVCFESVCSPDRPITVRQP